MATALRVSLCFFCDAHLWCQVSRTLLQYFQRYCLLSILPFSKTKKDISKRKTPFFCILKGLSNKQKNIFHLICTLKTTRVVVFYQRSMNDEVTDQTRKLAIESRWVVTEIYLTASVNAITLWINIKYHILLSPTFVCVVFLFDIRPPTHVFWWHESQKRLGSSKRCVCLTMQLYASAVQHWHRRTQQNTAQENTGKRIPSEIASQSNTRVTPL